MRISARLKRPDQSQTKTLSTAFCNIWPMEDFQAACRTKLNTNSSILQKEKGGFLQSAFAVLATETSKRQHKKFK